MFDADRPRATVIADAEIPIWGLSGAERATRSFRRAKLTLDDDAAGAALVALRGDWVVEERLVKALIETPGAFLTATNADGAPAPVGFHAEGARADAALALLRANEIGDVAGLARHDPESLGPAYNRSLRKRETPYALHLTPATLRDIERKTFGASYKGATDFVTKYAWPWPAFHATRWAAARGLTPNQVTTASLVLMFIALILFWQGWFLTGCAVGWAMTFLDTVDGKLARTTLTSSWWGNIYDHGIDLIHPPFWWWAWFAGLGGSSHPTLGVALFWSLWIILGGYVLGRACEGVFQRVFGISPFIWRPVDFRFRAVVARRNPNLFILMVAALLGAPDWGFILVAAWTVACVGFQIAEIVQAARMRINGEPITSFLMDDARPTK